MKFDLSRECARRLDADDKLAPFGKRFYKLPGRIYMDGNSLGLLSRDAEMTLQKAIDAWKTQAIDIWGEYFLYHDKLGAMTAPLLNAEADEVTVGGSTTVNIHQVIATFYKPNDGRDKILIDDLNFPTDRYAIASEIRLHGYDPDACLKVVKSRDGQFIFEDDIIAAMTQDVAVVFLPSALYRSAQLIDMRKISEAAHARGIYVGFDLCHSIGAIPHDFELIKPDFALWCNYKYLNAGPGAVAGLYINRKHFDRLPGLNGWWGYENETQFNLADEFVHQKNAGGWQIGTSSILSMAPLEGSLTMIHEAGIDNIREKSLLLTDYLMYLIDEKLAPFGFSAGNAREPERRTGHVALRHADAIRINAALKARGVIPDFRFPDVIRLAPVALYTSFEEIFDMTEIIVSIMKNKEYEHFENKRGLIA